MLKKNRRKLLAMLQSKRKQERKERIISELERAIEHLDNNKKSVGKTIYRPQEIAAIYNNEMNAIGILKSLVSVMRENTRL